MLSADRTARADETPLTLSETAKKLDVHPQHVVVGLLTEIRRELVATREELSEARRDIAEIKARQARRKGKTPKFASHEPAEEGKNKQAFDVADIPYYWSIPATQVKELREQGKLPGAFFSQKSTIVMREDIERAIRSRLTLPEDGSVTPRAKKLDRRDGASELTVEQRGEVDAAEDVFKAFEECL